MPFTFDENGALLITGLVGGSGAANRVAYWTDANNLGSDAGLLVDAANDMYIVADGGGIGISNADEKLEFFAAGYAVFSGCNVGIDQAIPAGNLHIADTNDSSSIYLQRSGTFTGTDIVGYVQFRYVSDSLADFYCQRDGANDAGALIVRTQPTGGAVTESMRVTSVGYLGVRTDPDRRVHAADYSALTGVIIPISRIESQVSGGAGAAGHGAGFEYYGETSTTLNTAMTVTAGRWSVATHASRRARFEVWNYYIANDVLCGVIEAPNTASPDGNARGVGAVDFQTYRGAATQVASGNQAFLGAGSLSTASGTQSCVVAGTSNTVSQTGSGVLAGDTNSISGGTLSAIIGGSSNTITASRCAILAGDSNTVSANDSVAYGSTCTADGINSFAGGVQADTNGFAGVFIWSDAQVAAAFNADRNYQFKVRCNGTATFVTTDTACALPVAEFNQADVDEPFYKVVGDAAAATLTRNLVDEGDVTTATRVGWHKIEVTDDGNQITDGDYFVPFYSLT